MGLVVAFEAVEEVMQKARPNTHSGCKNLRGSPGAPIRVPCSVTATRSVAGPCIRPAIPNPFEIALLTQGAGEGAGVILVRLGPMGEAAARDRLSQLDVQAGDHGASNGVVSV